MLQSNFIEAGSTEATEKLSPRAISAQIPEHGIVVTEIRHPPGRTDLPKEDFARFLLILSGNARLQGRERRYVAGPETLFHIPAGLAIHQEIPPNNDILGCVLRYKSGVISPSLAQQLFSLEMVQLDLGAATVSQARGVQAIFREMLFEQDTRHDGWEMILLSRLIEVAVRVVRLKRRKPNKLPGLFEPGSDSTERVARYAARLKTQFFRQETLNDAARSVGLGCRQFSELFRKLTGESWRQHVLGLRLKHAMGLLLDTDRSISAVAFESGFDDLSNFHHIFKTTHGCSPLAYRKQRRIKLPSKSASFADDGNGRHGVSDGFQFRGIKGWCWTPEQYLQEIPVLAGLKMNFLMNCYRSMSVSPPGEPWCNEWWRPLNKERKKKFTDIIHSCQLHGISFCLAMHPQLASPRPLLHGDRKDLDAFYKHYEWAQNEGVKWFAVCLDDTSWGFDGPAICGARQSATVNTIYERLRAKDAEARMIFCPASFWGDGSNPEHAAYLSALARILHPDIYVFWNGDAIVTPRITSVAAQSYRSVVQHRLFLWDNYPVNDGNPTMHLGPLSGREPDLCESIEGYISNPMCSQNEINRLPLATAAEYAFAPHTYKPLRSIGQSILRLAKTPAEQMLLKQLVEQYPGFIVAGGGTGTNPARAKFSRLLTEEGSRGRAIDHLNFMKNLHAEFTKIFPSQFSDAKTSVARDIEWMNQELARTPCLVTQK